MDLAKLSTSELVKLLGDSNNWMRRMARRMLVEKRLQDASQSALESLASDVKNPASVRLEALWTLHLIQPHGDDMDANMLGEAAGDKDPALRAWAARISGERFRLADRQIAAIADKDNLTNSDAENAALALLWKHTERLDKLDTDPDITVRLACAISRQMTTSKALTINRPLDVDGKIFRAKVRSHIQLGDLIRKSAQDADGLLSYMIWRAFEPGIKDFSSAPEAIDVLANSAPASQPLSRVLSQKAMRRLCDTRDAKNLDLALDFLVKIKAHDVLLAYALDGLEKGQESGVIKPTKPFSALFAEFAKSDNADVRKHAQNLATLWGDAAAIRQIAASLLDAKTPEAQRIVAVQTLRKVRNDEVRDAFVKLLSAPEGQPSALIVEAVRAAADTGGDAFIAPLTKLAAAKDYGTQLAALGALANRADWTHAMLDAISAKSINAIGFPVSVRRQLATSKDKAIRDHAFKVLGAWKESGDDIKALITAKKKACLEGEPDLANGKILFTATCGVCHAFHGGGQKVGPELIGSGRSNLDALLANVIDPNQIIGNGYENFTITTKDNRTLAGRVTEDTPSHVKLLAIGGAETVVPRDQIATSVNTHQSLMPMGFGQLPDNVFRDLIWYILAPPEEGPLTAEKKARLSASIDMAAPAKPRGTNWRAIDWESISLWNPQWKVSAPDFERTPVKLAEYHGKTNVLLMHPFPDKKTPTVIERKQKIEAGKTKLHFSVAADDRGDWKLIVTVNGEPVKQMAIDHEKPRWKDVEIDLAKWAGQEASIRLEGHANGWSMEFDYWHGIRID